MCLPTTHDLGLLFYLQSAAVNIPISDWKHTDSDMNLGGELLVKLFSKLTEGTDTPVAM
jgi:hypothetical protein